MKKRFRTLLPVLCLLLSCAGYANAQSHKQQKRFFPKPMKNVYFGMSIEDFARKHKRLPTNRLQNEDFRYTWLETFGEKGPVEAVLYIFGDKEEKPLYEVVIFYRDIPARTRFIEKAFGPPNHESVEWKLGSGEGFVIRAWNYEERLVIVAELPGTEWGEK